MGSSTYPSVYVRHFPVVHELGPRVWFDGSELVVLYGLAWADSKAYPCLYQEAGLHVLRQEAGLRGLQQRLRIKLYGLNILK